jgi:RNA polymerase sigma-70 factor (ECF subfamily)
VEKLKPESESSAAELVRRIQAGDRRADEELIARFGRGVSIILSRATGGRAVAEDLYQDTFQIALEKIRRGDLREPDRLSGFICSLARNLATEYFRRERRPERHEALEEADHLPDPAPSQLDQVLQKERAGTVRQVLSEMETERDRQILLRFYIVEEEKEQICVDLGLSDLHFNRVLFRARQRFKQLYEKRHE